MTRLISAQNGEAQANQGLVLSLGCFSPPYHQIALIRFSYMN
jgi:hypothetical protein